MFKIDLFVDDKNLAEALRRLSGIGRDVRAVPVVNAEPAGAGVKAETSGELVPMFLKWIAKHKKTEVVSADARQFLEDVGRSGSSKSYVLRQAVEAGMLKRRGSGSKMRYDVVDHSVRPAPGGRP